MKIKRQDTSIPVFSYVMDIFLFSHPLQWYELLLMPKTLACSSIIATLMLVVPTSTPNKYLFPISYTRFVLYWFFLEFAVVFVVFKLS